MGTTLQNGALLGIMTMFFAVLALNIAVPAMVLSIMALARWIVLLEFDPAQPKGVTT
ncbi:hypothetical protein [Rhizobium sp. LC145]|jgi:hypothetical protein|uniref:hypothetical protein n=1 Tax=Rhizobium sp. LC145 TaxID=1120688 RepID=UPI00062A3B03|nr:hypothetical protein [Rhizobium sp. LC145]KKX34249.1 membrane protein [Rhizobium sp. LC145]